MYLLTDEGIKSVNKKSLFKQKYCKHNIIKGEHCLAKGETRIKYTEIFEVCKNAERYLIHIK